MLVSFAAVAEWSMVMDTGLRQQQIRTAPESKLYASEALSRDCGIGYPVRRSCNLLAII